MALPTLTSDRFTTESGFRVTVQVPNPNVQTIVDNILTVTALKCGDYDRVTFATAAGVQQFRSLEGGRNSATEATLEVPCVELSVFVENSQTVVTQVIEAIYFAHPYEEPVIFVEACLRTLHIQGLDENNPNRFWNAAPADWVPKEHK